ncbi:HEPN domain-containing protein [Pseudomonas sp. R3-52-08]|uniref:HEPN domain-containing protein n=1 Tax=Pseudomonas sp. R3-52-08 TaxID=1173284 RepID=UPI000F56C190|nr:HEPN domain-containing protein [Pseudomonas sp. R3-52-08]AZF20358.1 hypothetical protein C4J91_1594 [Pseudomonas sp. R3-52-08]
MNFLYIVGLTELQIKSKIQKPIKISAETFITNNSELIKTLIPKHHIPVMGMFEYSFLTDGRPVLFKTGNAMIAEASHLELINFLRDAHALLISLWMNRDSSANCDTGFAIGVDNDQLHTNNLTFHYSLANGKSKTTIITQDELEKICSDSEKFFRGLKEQENDSQTVLIKTTGRINISSYHLQMARAAGDLAMKVASYCSFFESLFSTTSTELSHQLSERVAFSLSDDPYERLETFTKIKKAYNIRSKSVHGDVIQAKDLKGLIETAEYCDLIARKIYSKIITCPVTHKLFSEPNEKIEDHMRSLLFGITKAF